MLSFKHESTKTRTLPCKFNLVPTLFPLPHYVVMVKGQLMYSHALYTCTCSASFMEVFFMDIHRQIDTYGTLSLPSLVPRLHVFIYVQPWDQSFLQGDITDYLNVHVGWYKVNHFKLILMDRKNNNDIKRNRRV